MAGVLQCVALKGLENESCERAQRLVDICCSVLNALQCVANCNQESRDSAQREVDFRCSVLQCVALKSLEKVCNV